MYPQFCCPLLFVQQRNQVGEHEHGNREYTLDCLDEDSQRYVVHHTDLLGAVCELAVLLGCDLSDV